MTADKEKASKRKLSVTISAALIVFMGLYLWQSYSYQQPEKQAKEIVEESYMPLVGIEKINPPFEMPQPERPVIPAGVFDVKDYGAVGDGKTPDTKAFADAIKACAEAGGGTVLIPEGTYFTGPIHLKGNINLHVHKSATLIFSDRPADYLPAVLTRWEGMECMSFSPLIYARDCENVALTGKGIIDGNGQSWWHWKKGQHITAERLYEACLKEPDPAKRIFADTADVLRPPLVQFFNCSNVLVEGPEFRSGPMWTIHPVRCENLIVRDIRVITSGPNNDGVNPDGCRNVLVEHCYFDTGDDCVTLKSGINEEGWRIGKPTENVVIRHIETRRGHGGVVIGSDMSGGVRNVYAHHCTFNGTERGLRIKSMKGRGGIVENIWFEDVEMDSIVGQAVQLNMYYQSSTFPPAGDSLPLFRNIFIRNVHCGYAGWQAINILGRPDLAIQNVQVENFRAHSRLGAVINRAEGVQLISTELHSQKGPALLIMDSENIRIEKLNASAPSDTLIGIGGEWVKNIQVSESPKPVLLNDQIKPNEIIEH